ncbi:MAG TPA: transglutaminase family protein [Tepidisphaeraceae bacterium]|nr:transglutaminase family protein [Tepidisphaeraceae bacterium]
MRIKIGFDLAFGISTPTPMLLMLYVHPSRQADLESAEILKLEPDIPVETFIDVYGNKVGRIVAPPGDLKIHHSAVVHDSGKHDIPGTEALQHPVNQLLPHILPYLFSSRYCEVDRMADIAWSLFGQTPLGWPRVMAVQKWVHEHIQFGYEHARKNKTAYDAYVEKRGVCRDYMHLSITFLRALNIPARYVTGYLGDIGVAFNPAPMDFSAWFEVFLGGQWWTCDARHNEPRIGRILMATGRDATDVALTTCFGPTTLNRFEVVTEEVT